MDINNERKWDRQLIDAQDSLLREATTKLSKIREFVSELGKQNPNHFILLKHVTEPLMEVLDS